MAAGLFVIQELRAANGLGAQGAQIASRFEWTSDARPVNAVLGGGRACPKGGWAQSGEQREVRTDYPGAVTPSRQILGPRWLPTTFTGTWDDRYNSPGYALRERDRFVAMARRGNLVRVQFQGESFVGLVKAWTCTYIRDWQIEYQFTFDPSDSARDYDLSARSPGILTVSQVFDAVEYSTQVLQTVQVDAPRGQIGTEVARDTEAAVAAVSLTRDSLANTLDQREISPPEKPTDPLASIASQFRVIQSQAFETVEVLYEARSDVDLTVQSAITLLDFEAWSRSTRFVARVLVGNAFDAAEQVAERVEPTAATLYRPREGESLYGVARRFYGSPFAWREIAARNRLSGPNLTGDELLVIPQRSGEGAA